MPLKLALTGNPNSGKTTLFNILTGSNQTIGNWPGVTVEKKEGRLVSDKSVFIYDLPGVYSLSPYTSEEIIVRNFLENERLDLIINIIDASNLERNLYLTTQLLELSIPTVIVLNMIDIVKKRGERIDTKELSKILSCPVLEISAARGTGLKELIDTIQHAKRQKSIITDYLKFDVKTEKALYDIRRSISNDGVFLTRHELIKIFEKDNKIVKALKINKAQRSDIQKIIEKTEHEASDTAENIIITQRYIAVNNICKKCLHKPACGKRSISDRIDSVVTNRIAAYPIFILIIAMIYVLSLGGFSKSASEFISSGVFGDGWFLFGIGAKEYAAELNEYLNDEKTPPVNEPEPSEYGIWIPGVQSMAKQILKTVNCNSNISSLITDGVLLGLGTVLGFIPQMFILFLCLSLLEDCGYMARIAFITDKILSRFGLSGKSFIPIIIGTGCGVPGVMASRTIECESEKLTTIATTTFMPCSAKLPLIALITGAFFNGSAVIAVSVYVISVLSIMISGTILKKIKRFSGVPAPFIMEMPEYHMPRASIVYKNVREKTFSFIKRAGTVIVLASGVIWILSNYGIENGRITGCEIQKSFLAYMGKLISPIFTPIGWGDWRFSVSALSGILAKENIVSTLNILIGSNDLEHALTNILGLREAYSFMIFNVLCTPCLAAVTAIFREMHNKLRAVFALFWQCAFAYTIAFIICRVTLFTIPIMLLLLFILSEHNKSTSYK